MGQILFAAPRLCVAGNSGKARVVIENIADPTASFPRQTAYTVALLGVRKKIYRKPFRKAQPTLRRDIQGARAFLPPDPAQF
jgi:hypothetical protein